MSTPAEDLPRYDKPPVSEVVFSLQFDAISALTPVHLGEWWADDRRDKYPLCEERPPLEPETEQFDQPEAPRFSLKLATAPVSPATWFVARDRSELIQVQRDRFTRNWTRSPSAETPYPSYGELQPKFIEDYQSFRSFLIGSGLGNPLINQCELTYVNPIVADGETWTRHGDVADVIAPWSGDLSEPPFLPGPEDLQLAVRYVIPSDEGTPLGRLLVSMQPVFDQLRQPTYLLNLTARGRPLGADLDGAVAFLDLAHRWIVKGFTALTTPPMHMLWRRTH